MSSLLHILTEKLNNHNDDEAKIIALNNFNQSQYPYDDLLEYLSTLTQTHHININLIQCLIESFTQWKKQSKKNSSIPNLDENKISNLFLKTLPLVFLQDFCDLFEISKDYQIQLLTNLIYDEANSSAYKRGLNIIVKFQYQLEFRPEEILLPLILNTKDHLIQVYIDKKPDLESYLLDLLNHLYIHGGRKIEEILKGRYNLRNQIINKKALGKLAVRYWNLYGQEQNDKYPNLAVLQHKRTLYYLINVKYSGNGEEKTMSNEAWNESVEEIVQGNDELCELLLEFCINKNDIDAVNYWMHQLKRPKHTLPPWMQRYINRNPTNISTTNIREQNSSQKLALNYYQLPLKDVKIHFIDSMNGYQRLLDRLFNNQNEELVLGFDCEWKPIFNHTLTSKERISIMQIAFSNEVFLLDLLDFFHKCGSDRIQQRLADRLFDDDHVTILCYGFKTDTSMLIASYPVFEHALSSGQTLLDLCLVQTELLIKHRDIFPYLQTNDNKSSKDKGLSELVRLCFGKSLNKSEQCSNWERRPLRDAQILYAANDAYCLIDIYNFLCKRLQSDDYLQSFRGKRTLELPSTTKTTNENSLISDRA